MVYAGVISAAEGDRLLRALAGGDGHELAGPAPTEGGLGGPQPARRWARYPLAAGSLLTALGAVALAAGYAGQAGPAWRVAGYVGLGFGLLVVLAGLWLARCAWLCIRISDVGSGEAKLSLALPLPLTLVAWAVRLARPFVRRLEDTALDETILALRDGIRHGQALAIDVSEDDDGERIQVSMG